MLRIKSLLVIGLLIGSVMMAGAEMKIAGSQEATLIVANSNSTFNSFDLDERVFDRNKLASDWGIVKQPGVGEIVTSKWPEKFKSDEEFKFVFMTIGAISGGLFGAGASLTIPQYTAAIGAMAGALVGVLPDMAINSYLYNNTNIGWIEAKDAEPVVLKNVDGFIMLNAYADIYDAPNKGKITGKIEKGSYRKIIERQKREAGVLYKVKINDEPIYRKYKIIEQSGWLKSESLRPLNPNIGDYAIVNEYCKLYDGPIAYSDMHDWLKTGSQVKISAMKTNDEYTGAKSWLNGKWYEIKSERLERLK